MPFDPSKFVGLDDRVRVVPPTPPEPEREPRRLHNIIEIIDRRGQPRAEPRPPAAPLVNIRGIGSLLAVLLLLALALLHHA